MAATIKLDRYRYISALGTGGMATVVLAEDTVLGRKVALKRMKMSGDVRGLSRLRREALIGASVSHPNLVSIYDIVTAEGGDQVIVMEYVPGENLRDALLRETRLAPADALRILRGVGAALDAIHRDRIVHRDVKPANILLGADQTVKLADLGVAAVPDRTRITSDGALVGTFSYMSPEQLGGAPATSAVDIYALSAVAFEALSGRKAHTEANPVALAHAISTQPPPDLRDVWPDAPAAAAEVLIRGMAKDPDQRPGSASELVGRLSKSLDPEATSPRARTVPGPGEPVRSQPIRGEPGQLGAAAVEKPGSGAARSEPALSATIKNATPAPFRRHGTRSRGGLIAVALVSLVALLVLLVVLTSGGGTTSRRSGASANRASSRSAGNPRAGSASSSGSSNSSTQSAGSAASASSDGSSAPTPASTAPASASAANPISAVESFYSLAASHRYAQAWALADPTFQNQLGGYQEFVSGQSGDVSIAFNSARAISESGNAATVAVQTTSVRKAGTEHCGGMVDLLRGAPSAAWAIHLIHISCS